MFTLHYDRGHNVLLARFTGVLSSQDIEELDQAVIAFSTRHGQWHGLVDLTGVEAVSMPASRILQRSQQPPFSPGYKRVFVAAEPQAVELARSFASHQTAAGMGTVQVVATLEEAYRLLRLPKEPRFDPVV